MGAWGTSLYANDSACDIRSDYVDKLKRGKSNEDAMRELIEENCDIIEDVEEGPLFWFALADTQWDFGRLLPEVKEKAIYFLLQDKELQRWRNSGKKNVIAWKKTLETLKDKLESPQPAIKKVSQYRLYKCKWKLGDVFAYQFSSDYSAEKGFEGYYTIIRKVSEDTWWPGHIVPVVQIYKYICNSMPSIDNLLNLDLLPTHNYLETVNSSNTVTYNIKLITESEKVIPISNLTFLGNLPGDDLTPFRGHEYWTGYPPVGWEASKYNEKFERYVIDGFLPTNDD